MNIVLFQLLATIILCDLPWIKPEELNRGLPSSISIYTLKTDTSPYSSKLTGAYARFNMNDPNLEFVVKDTNGDALGYFPKTPMEYANAEQNVVYAVINGGYFNMQLNTSASFLAEKGRIKSKNTINERTNQHPTVGAFGLTKDNRFQNQFIYSYEPNLDTYKFPLPNTIPGPIIDRSAGTVWNIQEGIGAGPILMKNGQIIKGNVENFDVKSMIDFRHPRSAICLNLNNQLLFIAIDGRYEESDGLTMPELANLTSSLNCWEAMNLDGGGSTCLFANNRIVNRPSDLTGPRPVVSAILIRDRFKKKSFITTE